MKISAHLTRHAGALLLTSLLAGCAGLCPAPEPPPPGEPGPAHGRPGHRGPPPDPAVEAAIAACKAALGLDFSGPPPPDARESMRACLDEAGVAPPPPPRRDESD
ncbi:MAG TPA: hypothetical protein VIP30_13925 [Stenotrophomonas sp.]|jgi:hypothetical protein